MILLVNLIFNFLGDDGVRVMKNNEINQQANAPSTFAEEAVDQLQASEKLIAGKFDFDFLKVMAALEFTINHLFQIRNFIMQPDKKIRNFF